MGVGVSILLIAAGAILTWAVTATVSGVSIQTVGVILLIVGIVGLVLSMIFWSSWAASAAPPAQAHVRRRRPRRLLDRRSPRTRRGGRRPPFRSNARDRQLDREGRAGAFARLDADAAVHAADELAARCRGRGRCRRRLGSARGRGGRTSRRSGRAPGRHAEALVGDREAHERVVVADAQRDLAAVRRVLDRVVEQVREDLAHLVGVGLDRRHVRLASRATASGSRAGARARPPRRPTASSRGVAALDGDVQRPRLEPAHPEDVVDDPREPLGLRRRRRRAGPHAAPEQRRLVPAKRERGAVDRRERRAELVRDRRDELALQALDARAPRSGRGTRRRCRPGSETPEIDSQRSPRASSSGTRLGARSAGAGGDGNVRLRPPPSRGAPRSTGRPTTSCSGRPVITSAAAFQMRTIPSSSTSRTPSATNASARAACARCSERR